MGILSACMSRHYVHVVIKKTEDDVASTGLGTRRKLGSELMFSREAVSALNHWETPLVPQGIVLQYA